jgi:tRNA (cytidine/uridine-2'-O-)-methyltransferase
MNIALFEPDIPQNTGSIIRLCACMGVMLHIIEPCGFLLDDKQLKRVAMDYNGQVEVKRHISWQKFLEDMNGKRLILLTTKAQNNYTVFHFREDDILILGRESSGVPAHVADACAARVKIPMHGDARSLNVALAAGMVLGEALRQVRI